MYRLRLIDINILITFYFYYKILLHCTMNAHFLILSLMYFNITVSKDSISQL